MGSTGRNIRLINTVGCLFACFRDSVFCSLGCSLIHYIVKDDPELLIPPPRPHFPSARTTGVYHHACHKAMLGSVKNKLSTWAGCFHTMRIQSFIAHGLENSK